MRLYIDSADLTAIGPLMKTGVFHGVTTNPHILKRDGIAVGRLPHLAERLLDLGTKELFLQSWGEDAGTLHHRGQTLARIGAAVVVKLPATRAGLEAAFGLAQEGVRTCVTAVYAPHQVLLAASVGAAYAAPYLGRMNDAGRDGHRMIGQMSDGLRKTGSVCEILAASVRTPEDVARLSVSGVRCITVSPALAGRLFDEPLTIESAKAFEVEAEEL